MGWSRAGRIEMLPDDDSAVGPTLQLWSRDNGAIQLESSILSAPITIDRHNARKLAYLILTETER